MRILIAAIVMISVVGICYAEVTYSINRDDVGMAKTMDRVCRLVPQVLGLKNDLRIKVVVLDRKSLSDMYYRTNLGEVPKAFYIEIEKTIYIDERYFVSGVLAHEVAHALMDEYFVQPVPYLIAEMVCNEVERTVAR